MSPDESRGVTHVLFDVDGTLIDSRPAIVAAYRHAFASVLGRPYPSTDDEVRALLAPRLREVCEQVGGARADECEAAYRSFYLESTDGLVTEMPGARDLLAGLVDRGVHIGLVTNKGFERLGLDLDRAGLGGFEPCAVVTAEDSVERKPDPKPILLALDRAGADPRTTLYVGDGPQDVLAAAAAGVRSVGATYGYYGRGRLDPLGPWAVVDAPVELFDLLDARPGGAKRAAGRTPAGSPRATASGTEA